MRILLFGANGQLGLELKSLFHGEDLTSLTRSECDLQDERALRRTLRATAADVVLNAAAYTAVDRAETDIEACEHINARVPGIMAEEADKTGSLLVHYSTDYVFDGDKCGPYREDDPTNPLNVYGKSKRDGELAVAGTNARHLILRTSWVFSTHAHNFVKTILQLARTRSELSIVDDQTGSPTSAAEIAKATWRIVQEWNLHHNTGLYHLSADGATNWAGFAETILDMAGFDPLPAIHRVKSDEYPTKARRPKNSVLSNQKFARDFGFRLPDWQEQLKAVILEMGSTETGSAGRLKKGEREF